MPHQRKGRVSAAVSVVALVSCAAVSTSRESLVIARSQ